MLHDQDQHMVMLNPSDRKKIYSMDLNRDDVVEEWVCIATATVAKNLSLLYQKVSDNYGINSVLPHTKYAQTTPCKTLVGLNDVGFFLMDPRLRGNKMVDSHR